MGVVKPYPAKSDVLTLYLFAHETCQDLSSRFINFVDDADKNQLAGSIGFIGIIKAK